MKVVKIYRTLILSDVLYGCESWSCNLREERRLSDSRIGCGVGKTAERELL
jgi:hypothetical protein